MWGTSLGSKSLIKEEKGTGNGVLKAAENPQ